MKRVLSLLVVLAMVFAMVPTTYAAKTEIDFDDLISAPLDDISEVNVSLDEGAGSVTYAWTPEADGILTFAIGELAEGLEVEVVLSQGENSAKLSDSGDGTVTLTVAAGINVSIVVSEANAAAAEFVMTGAMVLAGTESNPIMLTDTSVELTVPAGKTMYYAGRFSGMVMSFEGENVVVANNGSTYEPKDGVVAFTVAGGDFFNPPVIAITNNAEEAATYAVSFNYPVGTQMNPEVLEELGWADVSLEEGNDQGYYYSYTAPADGAVLLYIGSITEGVTGDIVVTNMNTYAQRTLLADGVDNYGLELTVEVAEGDELIIQVMAAPDASWNVPAADVSWAGNFIYPEGSEQNPIYPEFVWNDENTEATATVTAPVGTTYYAVYGAGMMLTINDGEPIELVANGMGRVPAIFTITNDGEAEAQYSLKIAYPAGTQMNPEVLEELQWYFGELALEEGDNDGYYYSYTAPADGSVLLYIGSITEGVTGDIVVNNMSTYEQKSLLADGVDNYGLELTVEVAEGDELIIQVMAAPDASWNVPAADISWTGNFTYPEGTKQNPIIPEWEWNEEYTEATAAVTVPAGETLYFMGEDGMLVSINGGEPTLMKSTETESALIVITNAGEADAQYLLKIWYPVGTMANPEVLETLGGTVKLEEGDFFGYYYSFTAQEDGSITVKLDSVTEGVEVDIRLMNNSTYQMRSLSEDGVNGEVTMAAAAGDVITINVVAMPDANWNYPAADAAWSGSFEAGPIGVPGDMDGNGEVTDADALYLLRYTLFPDRYPITQEGDVNSDGDVTDADALYLLRYTLFPDRYPLYPVAE